MTSASPKPRSGLRQAIRSRQRPIRREVRPLGRFGLLWQEWIGWRLPAKTPSARSKEMTRMVQAVLAARMPLADLSDTEFSAVVSGRRARTEQLLTPAGATELSLVVEAIRRETGLVLRANQITCALLLLAGECVELRTGEGKTLAAALAALAAGRCGVPVHVVTVNDYLAQRDHDLMAGIALRLGVSTAVVLQKASDDDKRAAYDHDVVYGTNKTFVFDALRDRREAAKVLTGRMAKARPRQMGQAFAIVDEADSVLVDDATVPMILSEPAEVPPDADIALFAALLDFAAACRAGHERVKDRQGNWRLTPSGLDALGNAAADWFHPVARDEGLIELAETALSAQYSFRDGVHYVLREGEIAMIDQATGRLMPDRKWSYGMQQMVEIKEGAAPSSENRTVGQITQQTYFRQYRLLSGLTGTARECRAEFWSIYRLRVRPVAPHAPSRLARLGFRVHRDETAKFTQVAERALQMAESRAVLIGLNDVAESAALQRVLAAQGHEVAVLDALSEEQEAELVAQAGQPGRITIATHLAGRGTDIGLGFGVREAGGLHVIIASAMASGRLERQLYGRAGRAGDPGSYEVHIALTDRGLTEGVPPLRRAVSMFMLRMRLTPARALAALQAARDNMVRRMRKLSLLRDQELAERLGHR